MTDYKSFLRKNLRRLRIACGYTQDTVAEVLGVTRSTYTYYETGKTMPDLESITKLARMFGVSLEQLISPDQQPEFTSGRMRVKHHPAADPGTIGELTEDEKVLIARRRSERG